MSLRAFVNNIGDVLSFNQANDGWWINREYNLAINEDLTTCVVDKWNADFICEAPTYEFEIVETVR